MNNFFKFLIASVVLTNLSLNAQSQAICHGSSATLTPLGSLTTPTLIPGNLSPNSNGVFVVTPSVTTSYTIITTSSGPLTNTTINTVTVNPTPYVSPSFTQFTCSNPTNCFDLGLTFVPAPTSYTVFWSGVPMPNMPTGVTSATTTSFCGSINPGVYDFIIITQHGCGIGIISFTMNPMPPGPNFTLSSNSSFTLGCDIKSTTTVFIATVVTVPPSSPVSYTYLPPGSSNVLPSGTLSPNNIQAISAPGVWTVCARDDANGCVTRLPFNIIQNINPPDIMVTSTTNILTCNTPSALIQFSSTTPSVSYFWSSPAFNQGNSFMVSTNTSSPSNTLINNYTLSVMALNNFCSSSTVFPVFQNIFPPSAFITSSAQTFCAPPGVTLFNASTSNVPVIFPHPLSVSGLLWQGPTPQQPLNNSDTYTASTPGTYTLTTKDLNNGCTSQGTFQLYNCTSLNEVPGAENISAISLNPNPSPGALTIAYSLEQQTQTTIELINMLGQHIKTILPLTDQNPGEIKITTGLGDISPGIYFIKIRSGNEELSRKLIVSY